MNQAASFTVNGTAVMTELTTKNMVKLLKSLDNHLYLYPNPGNAGDSLITCATMQFFERYNISYEIVQDASFDSTGRTVLYAGGGNFGGTDSRAARFMQKHKDLVKNLVFLPHTIYGAEDLLAKLKPNSHIICRERVSYDFVKTKAPKANTYLHDDIVFQSDVHKFMENRPEVNFLPYIFKELLCKVTGKLDYDFGLSLRGYLTYKSFLRSQKSREASRGAVLKAFRIDVEKTSNIVPKGNVDLSAVLELSACKPDLSKLSCYHFLTEIDAYAEVHTNRLHIAIGAACLGKNVKLYANNYFKIKAIYEYSILSKFDNVEWCGLND